MKRLLTLSLMLLATTIGGARTRADVVRTVYFSAFDAGGAHVTDLTEADLKVKEGGKDRTIDAVKPASAPMQVSILVDDGGTGGFQASVGQFIQATFARAEFAIRVLSPQAIKVMVPKNGSEKLIARIVYNGPVRAPVQAGQPVGVVKVWRGANIAVESPVYAAEAVGTGSTMRRAIDGASELVIGMFRASAEKL